MVVSKKKQRKIRLKVLPIEKRWYHEYDLEPKSFVITSKEAPEKVLRHWKIIPIKIIFPIILFKLQLKER